MIERRTFIKGSLATTAVAMTAQASTQAGKIKVGQIGTTHAHASGQLKTCRDLSDLYDVVGVVEPDADRRRQLSQTALYRGLPWLTEEELLSTPGLQVVAVETEVRDLLPTAQRCVDAGKHIHLDKPAGESLQDLVQLHKTAREKDLKIQMGYMYRYNPAFRFLFEAVKQGWLGNVFEIDAVMSKTVNDSTRRELAEYPGGSMFELGCHIIDPLVHIMGPPQKVTAFNRATRDDGLLDNTLAVFEYPKATATIRSALVEVQGNRRRQFIVCGDQGTIVIRPLEPPHLELTLAQPQGGFDKGHHTVELQPAKGRYHGAWEELGAAIQGKREFPFSYDHDLAVQRSVLVASGLQAW